MSGYTNGTGTILSTHVAQLDKISSAVLRGGRRRAADTAVQMSQRGAHKAAADRLNLAMMRLIELVFEEDETGRCNVDADGRLLVSTPWGRHYQRFGLRANEAAVLALHVKRLCDAPSVAPLFVYDGFTRSWYLNYHDYPTFAKAVNYWRKCQLGAGDYLALLRQVQAKRGKA